MNVLRVRVAVPMLAAMSLLACACASPPEAEKKAADAAASAATAAGADKYAPGEFSAMTAAMRKAETEMSAKAYKEAKISYESAKVLAEQAVKAAESGKTAARAAAEKQIAEVQGRWKDLAAKTEGSAKKLNADQQAVWNANGQTVAEAIDAAKASLATDADAAKAKLASAQAVLDQWEADLAAIATQKAAPAARDKSPAARK